MTEKIKSVELLLRRFLAFTFDTVLLYIVFLKTQVYIHEISINIEWKIFFVIMSFQSYFLFTEILFRQTLGKFLLGLIVETKKYSIINIILRNLTRVLIFLPPFFLLNEIISFILTGKTVRDIVTDTNVIYVKNKKLNLTRKDVMLIDNEFDIELRSDLYSKRDLLTEFYILLNKVDEGKREIICHKFLEILEIQTSDSSPFRTFLRVFRTVNNG